MLGDVNDDLTAAVAAAATLYVTECHVMRQPSTDHMRPVCYRCTRHYLAAYSWHSPTCTGRHNTTTMVIQTVPAAAAAGCLHTLISHTQTKFVQSHEICRMQLHSEPWARKLQMFLEQAYTPQPMLQIVSKMAHLPCECPCTHKLQCL